MYGQFNNPYPNYPAMQNRLANLEAQYGGQQFPQFNNRPQMPSYLKGRMVTSIDEAKASQFDLDGSITFFPSLAESKIYAKTLDNNGLPVFMEFIAKQEASPVQATNSIMEDLLHRVERLEKELGYESTGNDANSPK